MWVERDDKVRPGDTAILTRQQRIYSSRGRNGSFIRRPPRGGDYNTFVGCNANEDDLSVNPRTPGGQLRVQPHLKSELGGDIKSKHLSGLRLLERHHCLSNTRRILPPIKSTSCPSSGVNLNRPATPPATP